MFSGVHPRWAREARQRDEARAQGRQWVETWRAAGRPEAEIREALAQAGWPAAEIEEAMRRPVAPPPATALPPPKPPGPLAPSTTTTPPITSGGGLLAIIVGGCGLLMVLILAALLFPVFFRAREKATQASCLANVKQLMLAELIEADGRRVPNELHDERDNGRGENAASGAARNDGGAV